MSVIDRLGRRARLLMQDEDGMALPFALFAMVASVALASAAILSSVDVQQGSNRDSNSKSAIAAADAGASVALMRLNRYASALTSSSTSNCLSVNSLGAIVVTGAVNGWCPTIEGTVGASTYRYQASPMVTSGAVSVVASGISGGVSRRVDVSLSAESVDRVLKEEGLIGQGKISLSGNPHIKVSIGTNGDIEHSGKSFEICGNARHGPGKTGPEEGELSCGGQPEEGNVTLPPVSSFMPTDIATHNSNNRLRRCVSKGVPAECEQDYYTDKRTETSPYDPSTRSISLSGNSSLTLGGEDYWLCQLTMSGSSHLIMSYPSHVRLFFDTPEDCGLSGPQISLGGNTNIEATGYEPKLGSFDMPGIYLLGSSTSTVSLGGNSGTNEFVLYAPETDITINGNATYKGVIAGRNISIPGNPTFEQDPGFEPQSIGGSTLFSRKSYVECSGTAVSVPNENC